MTGGSMQIETEKTAQELLEQWGIWMRQTERMGYSSVSPMWIGRIKTAGMSADITDAEAVMIDGILADLKKRDAEMGRITMEYYSTGGNILRIARQEGKARRKIDALVKMGTAWVDGRLFDKCRVA
jgi:hypothetical protein